MTRTRTQTFLRSLSLMAFTGHAERRLLQRNSDHFDDRPNRSFVADLAAYFVMRVCLISRDSLEDGFIHSTFQIF